jgi:hypothetical protein
MPPKRAQKPAAKDSILTPFTIIILGDKQQPEPLIITLLIKPPNKPTLISSESFYSLKPFLITNNTKDTYNIRLTIQKRSRESSAKNKNNNKLI